MWFKESDHHAFELTNVPLYTLVLSITSIAIIAIGIFPSLVIELFW
jgi:hypothetical protein